jgi:hypothetical protein
LISAGVEIPAGSAAERIQKCDHSVTLMPVTTAAGLRSDNIRYGDIVARNCGSVSRMFEYNITSGSLRVDDCIYFRVKIYQNVSTDAAGNIIPSGNPVKVLDLGYRF